MFGTQSRRIFYSRFIVAFSNCQNRHIVASAPEIAEKHSR